MSKLTLISKLEEVDNCLKPQTLTYGTDNQLIERSEREVSRWLCAREDLYDSYLRAKAV